MAIGSRVFTFLSGKVERSMPASLPLPGAASLSVNGIYVGSRAMQEQFQSALAVNRIHPVIDGVFEMQQAREAYEYLRSGRHFEKIVIRLD
jgi:NADPH:quinone reductase-like Zn-dependent oxidoreductase